MKARLGAALFGIGVLSLVVAAGAAFYVAPSVTKLPYDLTLCDGEGKPEGCLKASVAVAENAQFMQVVDTTPTLRTGNLEATTEVVPQAETTKNEMTGDLEGKAVVWDVYGTVKWVPSGAVINQYVVEFALDRVSAEAVAWDKQYLDTDGDSGSDDSVEMAGQTYKFPFHTARKDYEYFDRDLRRALPIKFDGTEQIKGTETYRFVQIIEETDLNMPAASIGFLTGAFAPEATSGKVLYSNTRTIWVEPVSGNFVKVREQQKKTLVPDQGPTTTLLDGDFNYTEETIDNSLASAGDTRSRLLLISRNLPIGLAVFGLLLIVVAFLVSRRSTPAAVARHAADPAPTRVDQPAVRGDEREGGPLTDEIPPASTNWKSGEPTVPGQRPAQGEAEKH